MERTGGLETVLGLLRRQQLRCCATARAGGGRVLCACASAGRGRRDRRTGRAPGRSSRLARAAARHSQRGGGRRRRARGARATGRRSARTARSSGRCSPCSRESSRTARRPSRPRSRRVRRRARGRAGRRGRTHRARRRDHAVRKATGSEPAAEDGRELLRAHPGPRSGARRARGAGGRRRASDAVAACAFAQTPGPLRRSVTVGAWASRRCCGRHAGAARRGRGGGAGGAAALAAALADPHAAPRRVVVTAVEVVDALSQDAEGAAAVVDARVLPHALPVATVTFRTRQTFRPRVRAYHPALRARRARPAIRGCVAPLGACARFPRSDRCAGSSLGKQ